MLDKSITAYSALRRKRLPDTASVCENTVPAAANSCFPICCLDGVGSKLLAGKSHYITSYYTAWTLMASFRGMGSWSVTNTCWHC